MKRNWTTDLTPRQWQDHQSALLGQLLDNGGPIRFEQEYINKNGLRIPVELLVNITNSADGKTLYYYTFVTDLSERKQFENKKITNLLESVTDGFYSLNRDWIITFMNQPAKTIFATLGNQLVGKCYWDIFPGNAAIRRNFEKTMHIREPAHFEVYASSINKWIQMNIYPSTEGISVFFQDISGHKSAQNRLIKAFNANPIPMSITTITEGRYIDANPAYLKALGLTRKDTLGFTSLELALWVEPGQRDRFIKLISQNKSNNYEISLREKSGKNKTFLAFGDLIKLDGEKYLLSTLIDITEHRHAEERFIKSFHVNPNPMAMITWPDGRYIDVNQSWLKAFGFAKDEIIGTTSANSFQLSNSGRNVSQILQEGAINDLEVLAHTKNGDTLTLLVCSDFIELNENKYVMMSMTDITQRKMLEQELARLDRLNLIGQMAAGIAHEIRNPMTVIKGYLQRFIIKVPQFNEQLSLVLRELSHIEALITDFLSLARNKITEKSMLDLNDIVKAIYPLILADANKLGVDVQLHLPDNLPFLLLNEKEIKQLLLNLSRNGIEALSGKGTLRIETRFDNDSTIFLAVINDGPEIPRELQKKIFDPFYTTKDHGTGLGLSICASIAERHNGFITVNSAEGLGTSFLVRFGTKP